MKFRNGIIIILLLMALVSIPISFASDLDLDMCSNQLYDNDLIIDQELDEDIISDSNSENEESADFNENIQASDSGYDESSLYEVYGEEKTVSDLSSPKENILSDSSNDVNILPNLNTDFSTIEIDCLDTNTIYVNASYTGSQEYGTKLNPYKSITDGFNHLSGDREKTNIFIAKGSYSISGHISIYKSVNIIGENPLNTIIDASNASRIFYIPNSNILVNIINLTLSNGLNYQGGAIYLSKSSVNIINSIFKNNRAYDTSSSNPGEGGVIYNNAGFLKIYNSTFSNNSIYGKYSKYGGVIYNYLGELSVFNSKFINNSVQGNYSTGGAIYSFKGFLTMFNSSILNTTLNSGYHSLGGAISIWDGRNSFIVNSTISGNTINGKDVFGSAIAHKGVLLEIINSTISNNYANGISVENSTVYNMNGNYLLENTNFMGNGINTSRSNMLLCLEDQLIVSDDADIDLLGDLPSRYDLRELGLLTSVKNQGSNGDCWAFAIYAALESYLLKFENASYDFSENNMKNAMYENGTYGTEFKSGGNHLMAFAYLLRGSGPVNESLDPYSSFIPLEDLDIEKYVTGFKYIPLRLDYLDNDQIKYAILQYGALYAPIYSKNIRNDGTGYSNISDINQHAVAIVGWDDNYSASNFYYTPPGDGAWIIKNSWGTGKGEEGYFYISYYDSTFPGVTDQFAAIAITSVENLTEYKKIYQYDIVGNSYESVGYNSNTVWFANQFTAESNNPLKAFGLYTFGSSSYLVNITVNGVSKLVQEGNLQGAGYHTVKLNQFVDIAKGNIFKITVRLTTPDSLFPVAVESKRSDYSLKVTAEPNQSFISPDGVTWYDMAKNLTVRKFYENLNRINLYETNVCLKAYTGFADDLALDVKCNSSYYFAGDAVQFNISIRNNGDPSGEINISSILDESVSLISHSETMGIFDEMSKVWTIDNLMSGESVKLILTFRFNEKKPAINTTFSAKSTEYNFNKNLIKSSIVEYATHTEFLKIETVNTTVKSGKSITIGLIDGHNNILTNKNVTLKLISSNNNYSMNPVGLNTNNGSVKFNINLPAGKYKFMLSFESDGYYDSSNYTFDVNVVKNSTQVIASNMNASAVIKAIDGKIGKYLKITLKDGNGNVLSGKTVIFTFKDLTFSRVTNKSGVARLQINIATAGTYSFKISFAGDEKFSASSKTVKVYIKKQSLKLTVPNKTYKLRNKNKYLTATLKNSKGKLIKNKKIIFTINGKKYTVKTNSKGIAKVKVSLSKRKTYKFTVKFAGDKSYNAVSKTAKVLVKR